MVILPDSLFANDLAFSSTTLVTVGYNDTIFVSTDGRDWINPETNPGTNVEFNGVSYGNSYFVAAGNSGTIIRSNNPGNSWEDVSPLTEGSHTYTHSLTDIAYGNGVFVAVGLWGQASIGLVLSSSDSGATWTDTTPVEAPNFSSISFANGRFFAGTINWTLYTSTNGSNWEGPITASDSISNNIVAVTYGNGLYMIADQYGNVATSTDGSTWEDLYGVANQLDTTFRGFCFGKDRFALLSSYGSLLWPYNEYAWLFPGAVLPTPAGDGYTSITWVPWLGNGAFVVTQMAAL
ncbi:hypothetical protein [Gracilinema caldarium]|uniref:WD40/YVTN/BNR-like repeat-containing protein n=1 Tax=Gracilinema caldarium TaxID=215591 RepID=UPI0026F0B355|nr:hypothetical protein [Gracilinema caldarium]